VRHSEVVAEMYKKISQRGKKFALAACLTILVSMLSARPVQAYGTGCTQWGEGIIPKITHPGTLCFTAFGSGENITSMKADFTYESLTSLCNWRIDWVIYYNGGTWWRDNGPRHGCAYYGSRLRGAGWAPDNSAFCAELYDTARNAKIDAVCLQITR
jgi:hypothetical protein